MKLSIFAYPAAAFAAAAVTAFGFSAEAVALPDTPGEWDIGAFDRCVNSGENQLPDKPNAQEDHIRYCCENSGGVWDAAGKKCVAPPAEPAEAPITKRAPVGPLQVLEPSRPTTTRVPGGIFVQNLTASP